MYVIEVIPLKRGVTIESLSYFSSVEYVLGTFLEVPVRGKTIQAVVVAIKPVSTTKTALKAATFSLRKLPIQTNARTLPQTVLDTVSKVSEYYPARTGSILFALLPPDVRSGAVPYPHSTPHYADEDATPAVLQANTEDRYVTYRSHIRSVFAHRGSVLFVAPTSADVESAARHLSAGIEERVVVLTSVQKKSERLAAYAQIEDLTTAKLIITTPSFAYLDRPDLTSIVVERSGSAYYKQRTRPYLDHREVLKIYAKTTGRSVILGDTLVTPEDEQRRRDDIYQTFGEHPKRLSLKSKLTIVEQKQKPTPEEPFKLFGDELVKMVQNSVEAKGRVFLYAARRGLAPLVVCFDCGYIFRCPDSGAPFSLLRTTENGEEKRWFLCSTSGKRESAADVCPDCGSWRLRERGIGIQQAADAFKKEFPDIPLLLIDQESAKTYKRASVITDEFYATKSVVLMGTTMALSFLNRPIDASAIISVDAVRAIPSWRTDENFFSLLLKLREVSANQVLVQTRTKTDDLLLYASRGAVDRFYDDELKLRAMLSYPPKSVFILLTFQGTKEMVTALETQLKSLCGQYKLTCYSSPRSTPNTTIRYGLLRIPEQQWPSPHLREILVNLPPQVKVEINPDRIV